MRGCLVEEIPESVAEDIQGLVDFSRIDERVKLIQARQDSLESKLDQMVQVYHDAAQHMAVLTNTQTECPVDELGSKLNEIDKRLSNVEYVANDQQDRWRAITNFIVQLVWIVIAAWVLIKMNLSAPPVP